MKFIGNYFSFVQANARFLGFGLLLAFGSSFGQTFFISVFGAEIRGAFGLSHGGFGALFSVATIANAICIVWLGRKIDELDLRLFSLLTTLGLGVAALMTALAPNVVVLALAVFALRLCGQGLMTHSAMTSMARYFERGRGRAISIASLGFPLGEGVLPIVAVSLLGMFGWRGTWLGIAAIVAVVVTPLVQMLLLGHRKRQRTLTATAPADNEDTGRIRQWSRREVLRDRYFYFILPAVLAPAFIITGFFFHQVHLVTVKGWSLSWFATCFGGFALSKLVVSLVTGPLVDSHSAKRILPYCLVPIAAGLMILAALDQPAVALVFMILAGFTTGSSSVVSSAVFAEIYGVKHLGAIRALVMALMVFASALSPVMFGWLIDAGVSIEAIAFGSAIYAIGGSLMAFLTGAKQFGRAAQVGR